MSKKAKKTTSNNTPSNASLNGTDKQAFNEIATQGYEANIRELTEKLARYKVKCDALAKVNENLESFYINKGKDMDDIVEFLNIKVQEHEMQISKDEQHAQALKIEKCELEITSKQKLEQAINEKNQELANLALECEKLRTDFNQLSDFRDRKAEVETQIRSLRLLIETKETEYKDTIHMMERKVLQDKDVMKREMLQRVNEAVANFRRFADQQMAETTKRAIRENMAITAQLKKMSAKMLEVLAENQSLHSKVAKHKMDNSILAVSEKDLARKNQANQRVIKMLVENIKESDKIIELANDSSVMESESDLPKISIETGSDDDFSAFVIQDYSKVELDESRQCKPTQKPSFTAYSIVGPLIKAAEADTVSPNPLHMPNKLHTSVLAEPKESLGVDKAAYLPSMKKREEITLTTIANHIPMSRMSIDDNAHGSEHHQTKHSNNQPQHTSENNAERSCCFKDTISRGVQTHPEKFSAERVTSGQLLSALRPWGPKAHCTPKKNGLYCPVSTKQRQDYYYQPKTIDVACVRDDSMESLYKQSPSTSILCNSQVVDY